MSNKCTFSGRVVHVGETQKLGKGDKPFTKRIIVVDDADIGSDRPNEVPFEYTGEKCKYLDHYKVGDVVDVDFFPSGHRWKDPKTGTDKWFGAFRIGYIKKVSNGESTAGGQDSPDAPPNDGIADVAVDDLPF